MRLLVIGGTGFSGRALSAQALAAGHELTLFHRTESDLFPDAEHVLGDRDRGVEALSGRVFDAVVDTCGYVPRAVGDSCRMLASSGWYGYVSSLSAHEEGLGEGATEDSAVYEPPFPDTEEVTNETYGPLKRACEEVVLEAFADRAAVIRPGYIVGPHDPTDRFTSWVRRATGGGQMLAPGPSEETMQFVDARDLAAFYLHLAGSAMAGTFGAVHPAGTATRAGVLNAAIGASGADTSVTWADGSWLHAELGEDRDRAFPMWDPDERGFHRYDSSRAVAAGLATRPLADTVRDTIAWDADRGNEADRGCGLDPDRERELLAAWNGRADHGPI
jgi:2'-hydroxyisoflavone reductase